MVTFSMDYIEKMSDEKCEIHPWGYKEYRRGADGKLRFISFLVPLPDRRQSVRLYPDGGVEVINWAKEV